MIKSHKRPEMDLIKRSNPKVREDDREDASWTHKKPTQQQLLVQAEEEEEEAFIFLLLLLQFLCPFLCLFVQQLSARMSDIQEIVADEESHTAVKEEQAEAKDLSTEGCTLYVSNLTR
jgi:hypothetical protein